jgi:hypothetical protein
MVRLAQDGPLEPITIELAVDDADEEDPANVSADLI